MAAASSLEFVQVAMSDSLILVHGGAGRIPPERRAAAQRGCRAAAEVGFELLAAGASALDAAQAAVRVLENDPTFNAGTGANLDEDALPFHDASIMRGSDLALGGVGAVLGVRHPIDLARAVLEDGRHCLLVGPGALRFARQQGVPLTSPTRARTEGSWAKWRRARASGRLDAPDAVAPGSEATGPESGQTVGAVVRDRRGSLAAATSTGGLTHRRSGRVGDSPLAGAGTYADDELGAISGTGDGEWMMRTVLAVRAAAAMRAHPRAPPSAVLRQALVDATRRCPGYQGGLIGLGPSGPPAWARTSPNMSVAWRAEGAGGHAI